MKFFRRRNETQGRERLPKILPSSCLGEQCVYFSGVECQAFEDLLQADGKSGGKDLPPFKDDSSYTIYGRVCTSGVKETLVQIRGQILKPGVNPMQLIALADRYPYAPVVFEDHTPNATQAIITEAEVLSAVEM